MNHYERLGADPGATPEELRRAYRQAAQRAHPDRHGGGSSERMAELNAAWRVLRDPERRRAYDLELAAGDTAAGSGSGSAAGAARRPSEHGAWASAGAPPPGPAQVRVPWGLLGFMLAVGVGFVLLGVIFYEPSAPAEPDNILRRGDCVALAPNLEAREVSCAGAHDATVDTLVPFGERCPQGLESFRDRQGMGNACVVRVTIPVT